MDCYTLREKWNVFEKIRRQPLRYSSFLPIRPTLYISTKKSIVTHKMRLEKDYGVFLSYAIEPHLLKNKDAVLNIDFVSEDSISKKVVPLLRKDLRESPELYTLIEEIDLDCVQSQTGHLQLRVESRKNGFAFFQKHNENRVSIFEFVVAPKVSVELMRARSFPKERAKNELIHFSNVYKHEMYNSDLEDGVVEGSAQVKPNIMAYATKEMYKLIGMKSIDFRQRFIDKVKGSARPLRVLSICSGAARIEIDFGKSIEKAVDFTLMDINSNLLEVAKERFSGNCKVSTIVQNVNSVSLKKEEYDIAICVSAVHHIVELEHVVSEVASSLNPNGEFWIIGEYIGKNGNRLWPESYAVANNFFKKLPEKYRLNRYSYAQAEVDRNLPNLDCSVASFEGIRSQSIEENVLKYFSELEITKANCFLWHLLNLTYLDNYDMSSVEDMSVVDQIIELEVEHFKDSGRPTELYGVYQKSAISTED